ncbi:MAG: helix-turn-helix transcriptional regulator [Carboxydocellales bacterium]
MWLKSFGLGITQGWLWLFFLNGPLLHSATAKYGGNPETLFITFLLFNSISYLLIAKFSKNASPFRQKLLFTILSVALMTAGTLVTGFMPKDNPVFSANLLITLGILMSGFGSAMLISAWGEQYCTLQANQASLAFGIAVTVGTIIFFVISILPLPIAILITAFIPLLSMILLLLDAGTLTETESTDPSRKTASFPFPTRLVVLVILFYLAGGLMYKLIASGQQLGFYENFWLTNIVYFAVCLSAGGILYFKPSLDLRFIYLPILPLLGIGFVIFPVLHSFYPVVPFTFLQTGFALFDLYTWIIFVYLASRHRFPLSVIAWGMFLITSTIMTGEFLFTRIFSEIIISMNETALISLLATLLMFIGTVVFRGEPETFAGWHSPSEPIKPNQDETNLSGLEMACSINYETNYSSQFALQYKLTPREKQILELLLEGRNNPYIRESLNISNNTLKTHLRNVYRKLSINDRQELLDLYGEF